MPLMATAIFVFLLYCVLDVALSDAERIRNFPKLVWLALVVLLPVIGGVAWLVAGRPEGGRNPGGGAVRRIPPPPRSHGSGGPGPRRPPRPPSTRGPKGPDDDPEFLRRLSEDLRRPNDDD